ncbi:MAG: hypothetical protein EKK51_07605 [Mycolicibacterium sp.]|uniref:hypothetical protein n=1 Tax=Mycolicibacterium sp. TaxID=2320850 RepID=UPI000F965BA1|nr:hypothetical protein [Mycolicibacterium sp.]RUP32975.1 MAG: hypothetical protein EKK51_07605 [Mycolicibacterium sp.]
MAGRADLLIEAAKVMKPRDIPAFIGLKDNTRQRLSALIPQLSANHPNLASECTAALRSLREV